MTRERLKVSKLMEVDVRRVVAMSKSVGNTSLGTSCAEFLIWQLYIPKRLQQNNGKINKFN